MASSASEIIEQIQQGRKTEELRVNINWSSLSLLDRNLLIEQTTKWQDDDYGYELLRLLYVIIPKTEFSLRGIILARVIIRENTHIDKSKLLESYRDNMKLWLEEIAKNQDRRQIELYKIFETDYYWLCGFVFEDKRDLVHAQERYQASLESSQKIKYQNGIQRATQRLEALKSRNADDNGSIPVEILQDRRALLQVEITKLSKELSDLENLLKSKAGEITSQEKVFNDLQQHYSELGEKLKKDHEVLNKIIKDIKARKKELTDLESVIKFLTVLPKVASGPLWVEVVRLALAKGQIDPFTVQALNLLSIECPKEAIPLLAEIAARSPDPFIVETDQIEIGLSKWFSLIAESRVLQKVDELKSAQKMVEAWDTFFAIMKNEKKIG